MDWHLQTNNDRLEYDLMEEQTQIEEQTDRKQIETDKFIIWDVEIDDLFDYEFYQKWGFFTEVFNKETREYTTLSYVEGLKVVVVDYLSFFMSKEQADQLVDQLISRTETEYVRNNCSSEDI